MKSDFELSLASKRKRTKIDGRFRPRNKSDFTILSGAEATRKDDEYVERKRIKSYIY